MGRTRRKVCDNKLVYDTAAQATYALAKLKRMKDRKNPHISSQSFYSCPACKKFHLTSQKRKLKDLNKEFKRKTSQSISQESLDQGEKLMSKGQERNPIAKKRNAST